MILRAFLTASCLLMLVSGADAAPLRIFAAASLKSVLDDFVASRDTVPVLVYAASSTLSRQIAAGAPADVFLSADPEYTVPLAAQAKLVGPVRAFAANRLVIASRQQQTAGDLSALLADMRAQKGRMVMGDTAHVPSGRYGRQALTTLGHWEALRGHLVFAADARAAITFLLRGEVTLGLVYASDLQSWPALYGYDVIAADAYPAIRYMAAVIKGEQVDLARDFVAALMSAHGQAHFSRYGFQRVDGT